MFQRILVSILAAVSTAVVAQSSWNSQLLPPQAGSGTWQRPVVAHAGRNWQLPDFSHVGYRTGAQPLASGLACNSITVSGSGDIADALQQAVDQLGQGGGGTVRIPAGSFSLSHSIAVPYDNVSILGAGSDLTLLQVPAGYTPAQMDDEGVFTFGKALGAWNKAWVDRGDELARVDQVVAAGATSVHVQSASALAVGQWVVLVQYYWPEFSQRNSGGAWDSYSGFPDSSANRESSFAYLRQITAINGNTVQLDAPVPYTLDPANNDVRMRSAEQPSWVRPRSNVGVAGLRIRFADNSNNNGRPAGAGVYFEGVRDAWVHDVQIENFPRYGIRLNYAARVTVRESAMRGAQDYGTGGYGYGISVEDSQSVLVADSLIEDTRHGITSRASLSNDLVITGTQSAQAREGGDDVHYGFVHNVLWDQHRLTHGTGLHGFWRGGLSGGAHETNGTAVLWNVQGDGHKGGWYGGSVQLNPSSDGWNIVVGGPGAHPIWDMGATLGTGEAMPAAPGFQTGSVKQSPGPGSRDQNVLYEGLYRKGLQPASLYGAQLSQRLGALPAAFNDSCVPAPAQGDLSPSLPAGNDTLIFNSDSLGFTPGCGACDLDDPAAARGLGEGLSMTPSSSNWSVVADFRGPTLHSSDFEKLVLWLRPSSSGFGLRLRLSLSTLPEGSSTVLGDQLINNLDSGWQRVELPVAGFGSGSFNTLELRSIGSASAQPVAVDDISLVPVASAPPACRDGIDNDGDGLSDYPADPGCVDADDNDESNPPPAACEDGVDNDGDGLTDYPADPGCSSAGDDDEYNAPEAACNDGVDNDGDGKIDFPADPGCGSADDSDETDLPQAQCADGIDNDGDRLVDEDDPGCNGPGDDNESPNNCDSLLELLQPVCLFR